MTWGPLHSDYYWDEQWGLHNTGQGFQINPDTGNPCSITGAVDADIDWLEVWESGTHGRDTIKIAIVDTGIESTHPDLEFKIVETWVAAEISEGPEDLHGHGTHVAGIAAAATNNGIGISGVGINAKVGSLKACKCWPSPSFCLTGICEDWDVAEAILYATNEGYHVINMSFGGPHVSQTVHDAVNQALNTGLVLVSSAGNGYLFEELSYPAAIEGVIAVAATDHYDNLASFSNFGDWVEVAAPGVNILSTYPSVGCLGDPDCYNWISGTSMAGPMVAGAAALVFDSIGGTDPIVTSISLRNDVINAILNNADHTGALGQNMLAWTRYGRLNLYAALTGGGENIPPVAAFTYSCNGLTCDFDASGSDDPDGSISSYAWNFGDDYTDSGMTTSHTYSAGDTYNVNMTVTDDDSATDTDNQSVTVSGGTPDNLHVGDLDDSSTSQSLTWWTASVTVTVHDGDHNTVEGAMVSGTWSGGASGTAIGTTDQSGLCTFSYPNIHKKNPSVTLTVDNITKNSIQYDQNNGNSITVLKP